MPVPVVEGIKNIEGLESTEGGKEKVNEANILGRQAQRGGEYQKGVEAPPSNTATTATSSSAKKIPSTYAIAAPSNAVAVSAYDAEARESPSTRENMEEREEVHTMRH